MPSAHTTDPAPMAEPGEPWGMVAVGAVLMAITSGVWYSSSVFFVALLKEFGRDYAFTSGIFSLFSIFYGISGLIVGGLVDRLGTRQVVLAGGILLPLALVGNSLAPSLGVMYATQGVLVGFGLCAMGYVPISILLTRRFRRHRGLAIGTASAGVGFGILAVVPLTQLLIDRIGWRLAYVCLAGLAATITLPVGLALERDRPSKSEAAPRTAHQPPADPAAASAGWALMAAVKSREFWLVTAAFTLLNGPVQLVLTHHVAHLVEVGQSKIFVAGIVGLVGLVSIPGKILWGFLSDSWWIELIYLAGGACLVAGIAALMLIGPGSAAWVLYVYAVFIGFGYAVSPAMTPILCGRFFSGRHFGVIFGALNVLYHSGGGMGVWVAGYVHDLTGSYGPAFLGAIASTGLAAACVWLAAPRRVVRTAAPLPVGARAR